MINVVKQSFKLTQTYRVNSFIYNLRNLPILKKIIPNNLYQQSWIKSIVQLIVVVGTILFEFVKKFLYIFLAVYGFANLYDKQVPGAFLTIFFFFTLIGVFLNPKVLAPNKQKYYSVIIMNMDAKDYAVAHHRLDSIINWVTFLVPLLVSMALLHLPLWYAVVLSTFVILWKPLGEVVEIKLYQKTKKLQSNNFVYNAIIGVPLLLLAFGLPYLGMNWNRSFYGIGVLLGLPVFVLAMKYLTTKVNYHQLYRKIVTANAVMFKMETATATSREQQFKIDKKDMKIQDTSIEKKHGYEYFNAIFFERHKRLLLRSARNYALVFLVAVLAVLVYTILVPGTKKHLYNIVMNCLPYFIFIMYAVNRGQIIAQAMFYNCDHSMLTYKFYRKPEVILNVFRIRLKMLMKINLIPALVIAIALPIFLWISGGQASPLIYGSVFFAIIFMSLFFSIHHLVIYYLLQPFNENMQTKSSLYGIVNGVTYIGCYICLQMKAPTAIISVVTIVATLFYAIVALFLVYKKAPKTFKLK